MRAIGLLLRLFTFGFNFVLSLGLFFLSLLVIPTGQHNIELATVPLEGRTLTYTLLIASIYAFVAMALARRRSRWARLPMLAWNILIPALLLWTPFRSSFSFQGKEHMMTGLYLLLASLVALWGSWLQFRQRGTSHQR